MEKNQPIRKVVLAFSGGLDTSFCVVYLRDKYQCQVITVTVDTGGFTRKELNQIAKRSKKLGAAKHYFLDGQAEAFKSIQYIIKANILRGGNYPMSVGMERLATAKLVSRVAKKEKADVVAHGSTGAGNDQLRFDLAFHALLPGLPVLAPIRELEIKRNEEAAYLQKHGYLVVPGTAEYSINKGLWGNSIGGGETHDSWLEIPEEAFPSFHKAKKLSGERGYLTIGFSRGIPVSLNGNRGTPVGIIKSINRIGQEYGIGKETVLTTSAVGLKARIGIEAPAALILIKAHQHLEGLTLTWEQTLVKDILSQFYREYIHKGLFFDPVVRDIEAFIDSSQKYVSGEVKVKLGKRYFSCVACRSPFSLMAKKIGVYGEETSWSGAEAQGFAKLSGLQGTIANLVQNAGGEKYDE